MRCASSAGARATASTSTTATIPQEAGLNERAVSFTKGCYVGQETVARLHYRGKPNRHLRGLRLSAPAATGERAAPRRARRRGASAASPSRPALGPIALALVRREAEPGATARRRRARRSRRGRRAAVRALDRAGRAGAAVHARHVRYAGAGTAPTCWSRPSASTRSTPRRSARRRCGRSRSLPRRSACPSARRPSAPRCACRGRSSGPSRGRRWSEIHARPSGRRARPGRRPLAPSHRPAPLPAAPADRARHSRWR